MMGYGGMGWGGMGMVGMIGMVLVWLLLISLVVFAVVRLLPGRVGGHRHSVPEQESAEEILDRRFARGDIDLETYQVQREALRSARGDDRR